MKTIAISDFKARCLALLDDVSRTGETLLVTKRGRPLARVSPGVGTSAASPQDTLAGTVEILDDVMEPVLPLTAWNAPRGVLLAREVSRAKPAKRQRR